VRSHVQEWQRWEALPATSGDRLMSLEGELPRGSGSSLRHAERNSPKWAIGWVFQQYREHLPFAIVHLLKQSHTVNILSSGLGSLCNLYTLTAETTKSRPRPSNTALVPKLQRLRRLLACTCMTHTSRHLTVDTSYSPWLPASTSRSTTIPLSKRDRALL